MDRIGRYRIIGELGRGAMGVVYHAVDPSIGRSVAIKTIRIQDINDTGHREKLRTRLFREARSAGVLSHPNIVTIYDMDEVDGLAYIAMAFVNGPTLEKILGGDQPLSGSVMLRVLQQAAAGLDYAHGRGIVHRDIKPANIMTDEDGAVKITDFGIAKVTLPGSNTETKTITGTPNYMSPEQVQGQGIDGRSDQFSLAVIAYEILTGERPFPGEALGTVVYKIVAEQPIPAHRLNGTLGEQIDVVLRKALSKQPDGRYRTCSEFVHNLEKACSESRGWKTVVSNTAPFLPTAFSVDKPVLETDDLPPRTPAARREKRRSVLVPAIMAILLVGGVAGLIAYRISRVPAEIAVAGPLSSAQPEPQTPEANAPAVESDADAAQAPKPDATDFPPERKPVGEPLPAGVPAKPVAAHYEPMPEPILRPQRIGPSMAAIEDVWVSSNPGGAKAVLDDNFAQSCQTPCTLRAPLGRHRIMFSLAGYISESREVTVGSMAVDVPAVALKQPNGSVMVSSIPRGANLRVDGRAWPGQTPATVSLAPGDHVLTVERDGQVVEKHFDVRAGSLKPWSVNFPP